MQLAIVIAIIGIVLIAIFAQTVFFILLGLFVVSVGIFLFWLTRPVTYHGALMSPSEAADREIREMDQRMQRGQSIAFPN